jgi:hypothetical protein
MTYLLVWAPEGRLIATVEATDKCAARRKAPKPYRQYLGEIAAIEDICTCKHTRDMWGMCEVCMLKGVKP